MASPDRHHFIPKDDPEILPGARGGAVLFSQAMYAKIVGLKMTNGDAYDTATHAPLWPWYFTVNPCDSSGVHVNAAMTLYLRVPKALSVDIVLVGGPGICGNGLTAGLNVVSYALSDNQTVAADGKVMTGDVLWHSLIIRHDLPILSTAEPASVAQRMLWFTSDEPDVEFGYTTGWEIDALYDAVFLRGAPLGHPPGAPGGADTHVHTIPANGAQVALGTDLTLSPGPTDAASSMPAFRTIYVIKWVGF